MPRYIVVTLLLPTMLAEGFIGSPVYLLWIVTGWLPCGVL